jgi:hypothetical protein
MGNYISDENSNIVSWSSTKTYDNDTWNFIGTKYQDNEEGRTYGNGVLDDLDTITEISDKSSGSTYITIGYHQPAMTSVWDNFLGYIDEIRIARHGILEDTINAHYNNHFDPDSFYTIGDIENNWNMITITRNETNVVKAYLNENQIDTSKTLSCTFDINHIGRGNSTNHFNGFMDEISIFTKELSPAEINELYNSGNGLNYSSFTQEINIEEVSFIGLFPYWNLYSILLTSILILTALFI